MVFACQTVHNRTPAIRTTHEQLGARTTSLDIQARLGLAEHGRHTASQASVTQQAKAVPPRSVTLVSDHRAIALGGGGSKDALQDCPDGT